MVRNPNAQDDNEDTLLVIAIKKDHIFMIKLLLEHGARITFNHRDWFKNHASQQIKDIITPPMPSVDQYSKLFQDDVIVTDVVPTTVETESTSKVVSWLQANKKQY